MKTLTLLCKTRAKLWKNAPSRNVAESIKTFVHLDHDADDFQNLIRSSLSTHEDLGPDFRKILRWTYEKIMKKSNLQKT